MAPFSSVVDRRASGEVWETLVQAAPAVPTDSLTSRELEVLHAIGRGLSNGEIAESLHISELTVKSHIGHIFAKLGLRDRAAAVVYEFEHGIVAAGSAG